MLICIGIPEEYLSLGWCCSHPLSKKHDCEVKVEMEVVKKFFHFEEMVLSVAGMLLVYRWNSSLKNRGDMVPCRVLAI